MGRSSKWNTTILLPLLFIIYINDLPDVCKQFDGILLFADDAKLLYKHTTCEDDNVSLQMRLDVPVVQKWSDRRLLKLK